MRPMRYAMHPLSRRTVLHGVAGASIALPWLEAMVAKTAHAAPPRRLILWATKQGTIRKKWIPNTDGPDVRDAKDEVYSGPGNVVSMKPMLSPLDPYKKKLLFLGSIDMISAQEDTGTTSQKGGDIDPGHKMPNRHMLTGIKALPNASQGHNGGISIDQEIARRIGGATRYPSVHLGKPPISTPR